MIGRYLDALAAADEWDALDRVIQAQNWKPHTLNDGENRCLVGHAANTGWRAGIGGVPDPNVGVLVLSLASLHRLLVPCNRFDRLCNRFGLPRVVRAIKQRAGKHTRFYTEQQSVETVR